VLGDIVGESARLDRMLANLLSLASIMAGRLTPRTEPTLLAPLAREVAAEVAARSPDHDFRVDLPAGLPPAEADPDLLAEVLRNLYENAVKYSPGGGPVRTSASCDDERVTIDVADRGSGIAAEHVPHVFERFRRPGADPAVRGMGLGLYLSRLLVEAQGGRITAGSPGSGLGATFSVTLPIARGWTEAQDQDQDQNRNRDTEHDRCRNA
jgi:signal transduction histidine kinase